MAEKRKRVSRELLRFVAVDEEAIDELRLADGGIAQANNLNANFAFGRVDVVVELNFFALSVR